MVRGDSWDCGISVFGGSLGRRISVFGGSWGCGSSVLTVCGIGVEW